MRLRFWLIFAAAAALGVLAACSDVTAPPHVFVSHVPQGVHSAREDGDDLKLVRWDFDPRAGLTRGYWVVRTEHEWRDLWPNLDPERIPLLPTGIDFTQETLLVAAPAEAAARSTRIHHVVDTAEAGVHVYLSERLPGAGCPGAGKDERVPVDIVRVHMLKKEVHFHVETREDDPCEDPPEAKIACRVSTSNDPYADKLQAEAGKTIQCLSQGKPGKRPTIDRTWTFRKLPQGTAAKMTIGEGARSVTFNTDAFGTYSLGLEITDDLQRRGQSTMDVEIAPPKDALVVQMLWTRFQPGDDPTTFPRVQLHVVGDKTPLPTVAVPSRLLPPMAARSQPWILVTGDCVTGTDKPPGWCRTRGVDQTTIMELALDAFPQYRIGVHYTDDRYQGQPVLCVRTFRGALATEWCDEKVRSEGNWWDVGRVDAQTGKVPVPPAPPAAPSATATPTATPTPTTAATANAPPDAGAPSDASAPSPHPSTPKPAATPKPKASGDPWNP